MLGDVFEGRWTSQAQPILVAALADRDPEVVLASLKTLTAYGDESAAAPAVAALDRLATSPPATAQLPPDGQRYHEWAQAKVMAASKRWTYTPAQQAMLARIVASRK
jgi:hypothetical protein